MGVSFLSWSPLVEIALLVLKDNFMVCINKKFSFKYFVVFVYVAPQLSDRILVWNDLSLYVQSKHNIVILGHFNQVEYFTKAECYKAYSRS